MSVMSSEKIAQTSTDVPLQVTSENIWKDKYRLTKKDGTPIDKTIGDTYARVATALANVEESEKKQRYWYEEFLWALQHGAIPAGRIISNAGATEHKPATSTINCTVSGYIEDSMNDILLKNHEAGLTLKAGCGIGYEFSTLRPKGSYVSGAGAYTSGPVSFMDIFDRMCFTVSSAGGRRGAQMATFDIGHPDIIQFIQAKREDGYLRQFNCSLLITDEFMTAVKNDKDWQLAFPITKDDSQTNINETKNIIWRQWPIHKDYFVNEQGLVACKVYQTIRARQLWDSIMQSTYDYAEPGFILIDKVNAMNNNWFCENIRATNPCGEQPLPPYGSCLLGSINLTHFVIAPFTKEAHFDWNNFHKVVMIFSRMLDNVVEINGLPLEKQRKEILRKRRHGMGFLGLGSTITMLTMKYGSAESIDFTEKISRDLAIYGWKVALELAKERGAAPIMEEEFTITNEMLRLRPEMISDGIKVGDRIKGKLLHAKYSNYMQRIAKFELDLVAELAQVGARYTHHSSIAPTGTISLSLANNASNGIEPSFSHHYIRNIIRKGKKTKEKTDVYSFELLAYRKFLGIADTHPNDQINLPDYFVTSENITPKQHVDIQAAAQKWVDSSISKTANIPTDFPFDEFKGIYEYAYDQGLKGCTTFRFNPTAFQGVLVKEQDLQNTTYRFILEDGSSVECKGDEQVIYDGETHSAANLFDAIKEGYYNKL